MSSKITIDMGFEEEPAASPICTFCIHNNWSKRKTCAAFPGGIPDEIWQGKNPHQLPVDGDHGIQFERRAAPTP
jgi:hypothetical protein